MYEANEEVWNYEKLIFMPHEQIQQHTFMKAQKSFDKSQNPYPIFKHNISAMQANFFKPKLLMRRNDGEGGWAEKVMKRGHGLTARRIITNKTHQVYFQRNATTTFKCLKRRYVFEIFNAPRLAIRVTKVFKHTYTIIIH